MRSREHHRHEIRSVPAPIKDQDRISGRGAPVMDRYSRVAFDRANVRVPGHTSDAVLLHPTHPLVAAVLSEVLDRYGETLRHGTILIEKHDVSITTYVVALLEHDVTD